VTQMGRLRWGADCEGVLVLVAEGDLSLVPAASMLFFVPTLFRLAVGEMPDVVVAGFADVGALPACSGLPTPLPLLPGLPTLFELGGSVHSKLNGYHNDSHQGLTLLLDDSRGAAHVVYSIGIPTDSCVEL
jgi:hypothetical protein